MKAIIRSRAKHNKSFLPLFFSVIVPVIIFTVSFVSILLYNYNATLSIVKQNAANALFQLSDSCESKLTTLTDTYDIFNNIPSVSDAMSKADFAYTPDVSQALASICNSYSYMESIYIYNQSANTVYCTDGAYSYNDFFTSAHFYSNYNLDYWKNFNFYHSEPYRILSPVVLSGNIDNVMVIPIVFQIIADNQKKNYLVFDINMNQLVNMQHSKNGITENSKLYILNKYTNEVFTAGGEASVKTEAFTNNFITKLLSSSKSSFQYKFDDGKAIVSFYSGNNSLIGYTYFAVIPSYDIIKQILPNIVISFIVILIFFIISILFAFKNTLNIYNPLQNIKNMLVKNNSFESSNNILEDITQLASNVQNKLETVLPGAQEKYLINLLNSNDYFIDSAEEQAISDSLEFPHNLFCVLIIQISPTAKLYDFYNSADYDRFKYGFYTVVKDIFSSHFSCYVLPAEHDMLYIILNFDMESRDKTIDELLRQLFEYLKNDTDLINISVGKSGIHSDIKGLKTAHTEALTDFKELETVDARIRLNTPAQIIDDISFDKKTQNELSAALLSANSDKVYKIIDAVVEKHKTTPPRLKKELYSNILIIVLKIMRMKKIPYKDDKLEFEIIYDCLNQPPKSAYNDMMIIVDYLLKSLSSQKKENTVDYDEIINYINSHFTFQDLSLKFLADYFNVNLSNLSSALKGKLSVGFHEYLTGLRIEKAKKLLITTKKNAQDICTECGFASSNTFFRVFKTNTGTTPNEFRKQNAT